MPEGHLYHRLARNLSEFSESELAAWSPQGRFAEGAARIDGTRLEVAEAHGKHLLVRFAGGRTVHVHLGMRGKLLVLQPHLWFASLVVCASRSGLMASAPS